MGAPGTTGTIEIPGLGYNAPFVVSPNGSVKAVLPVQADLADANDLAPDNGIRDLGVHVTTDNGARVNVYGLSRVRQTSDGFLAVPTETLGTGYVVQSYANVHTGVPPLNGSQFAIVAAAAGTTTVLITPSAVTGAHDAGVPYTITLLQGQTYQLRNTYGAPSDLSGTLVHADQPIAVFGSHRCANVESLDTFFCDYLVEQLVPIKRLGTEYFTLPLATRSGGDTVRILAGQDGTQVLINGAVVATLDHGEFHETLLTGPAVIQADKGVLVTQYANSSDHDGVPLADPFMAQVQHKGQYATAYRFSVAQDDLGDGVPNDFLSHYVNVIAPTATANANAVLLNGAAIPAGAFTAIGVSGFSGASVPVPATPPVHTVSAPHPVGVIVYGWGVFDSYAWPACFAFGDVRPPVLLCPDGQAVTLGGGAGEFPDPCQAPVPDFRGGVVVRDECDPAGEFAVTQVPPPGTLVGPGTHEILLAAADANENVGACSTTFTVIDPNANEIPRFTECPVDITVSCTSSLGAVVNFTAVAMAGCTPVEIECRPPSGSVFPPGTTPVLCRVKDNVEIRCEFTVTVTCELISIARGPNQVSLRWPGGGVLQVADQPTGPWRDVPTAGSQATMNARDPHKFYRVRK